MTKLPLLLAFALLATSTTGCDKIGELLNQKSDERADDEEEEEEEDDEDEPKKKKKKKKKTKAAEKPGFLADTGFRPEKDGFAFRNTGGRYPSTPPVLNENVMVKMFGARACVDGDTKECTLTLPAAEWAHMINRAMNGGQCEGMAVASLTMFKGVDKPQGLLNFSAHTAERKDVTPLIGYYWAYQAVDPVMRETRMGRRTYTPIKVEEKLVEMFKKGELATLAFWGPPGQGGHAVTPYAVEDKGNGIHHIKIYDNNYPDKERFIAIDHNANTWKYDLAAINPDVPKMPWGGGADSRNLVVIPLDLRLKKAVCPFCKDNEKKTTIWPRSSAVSITDQEGRKLSIDGGKVTNEIPDAEVVDLTTWMEGGTPLEPMYVLPADNDYDVDIVGNDSATPAAGDDDRGVTVFGAGTAMSVDGVKLAKTEKDTLSIPREGGSVRYRSGTGRMPALKLAIDDDKEGVSVRVANIQADADDEIELKHDRKVKRVVVQGGGKKTASYDLELKHVGGGRKGVERNEHRAVRFKLGESHGIETKRPEPAKAGAKPAAPKISRGVFVRKPRVKTKDVDKDKGNEKAREPRKLPTPEPPKERGIAPKSPNPPNPPPGSPPPKTRVIAPKKP